MTVTRIYETPDGESHFGTIEVELEEGGEIGRLSALYPAAGLIFRETPPGYDYDWHRAPARQYIVLLDGEIEVGSGERRRFSGGDILLVEDTNGRGHRTRTIGDRARRSLFIPIPN